MPVMVQPAQPGHRHGHGRGAWGIVVGYFQPPSFCWVCDIKVLDRLPDRSVDPCPGLLAGVQPRGRILGVRVVRPVEATNPLTAYPQPRSLSRGHAAVISQSTFRWMPRPVRGSRPRRTIGLQGATTVGVARLDGAQVLQPALDDRVIRLDAGVQEREAGPVRIRAGLLASDEAPLQFWLPFSTTQVADGLVNGRPAPARRAARPAGSGRTVGGDQEQDGEEQRRAGGGTGTCAASWRGPGSAMSQRGPGGVNKGKKPRGRGGLSRFPCPPFSGA